MANPPPPPGHTFRPTSINAGAHGTLRGVDILGPNGEHKARRFTAIPYAHPPVGELRWRRPKPLADDHSWSDIDAANFGGLAPQPVYDIRNDEGKGMPLAVPDSVQSEDCLLVNVWTPPGPAPEGGWPVWLFIHGGWLQIGNPAMTIMNDPVDLVGVMPAVVVVPGYRLGVFGFLAGKEIAAEGDANFGLWDQRLAIEWTAANAHHFGGNGKNITIAGLSAGAYSVHLQLCYELNNGTHLISRAIMYSNAVLSQPKSYEESQPGFDGLLEAFGIDQSLPSEEKMSRLRAVPMKDIVNKVLSLKIHTFRAVTDSEFIHPELYARIASGDFARRFADHGMALIIGETPDEEVLYAATNPPKSAADLPVQLDNYYPSAQAAKLCKQFPSVAGVDDKTLRATFGQIVAAGQVYASERALIKSLLEHVPAERVLRYRVADKPAALRKLSIFPNVVTHADDQWAWWFLRRIGFTDEEDKVTREWLAPVNAFLAGEYKKAAEQWYGRLPTREDMTKFRELRGWKIRVVDDERWDRCMEIATACT